MTLRILQQNAIEHDFDHILVGPTRDDTTCPICNPLTGPVPGNFYTLWRWINNAFQPARNFAQPTINAFHLAERKRLSITNLRGLRPGNRDILIVYRIVAQSIRYRRVPTYTASDLGYFFTVGSLLTNGYTTYPTDDQTRRIKSGLNPLNPGHQLETALDSLRRAWIGTGRVNRGRTPAIVPRVPEGRSTSLSPTRRTTRVASTERTPRDRTPLVQGHTLPPLPPALRPPPPLPLIPVPPPLPPQTPLDQLYQLFTHDQIIRITVQYRRERRIAF